MEKNTFYIEGATAMSAGVSVKNVFRTAKALYFQTADGISLRLTCEGEKGWRLQANTQDDASFARPGASQELANFMGEDCSDCAKEIEITEAAGEIVAACKCGSRAVLSLGDGFSLKFLSSAGECKVDVTGISVQDGKMILRGALEEKEGVYGGGERLDVVNKRGTQMDLYSCDGWNDSGTTYVVAPMYFTTRGGGMFFNMFEAAFADFGKTVEDEWSYAVDAELLDCYFYTSDDPAAVLKAYTELSGHAYMPEPWMQGMHICRYWPDFWSFDEDLAYDSLQHFSDWQDLYIYRGNYVYASVKEISEEELAAADRFFLPKADGKYALTYVRDDAGKYYERGPKNSPGGNSVKTIMENFIKADLKPDAASMEGYGWSNAFDGNENDEKNRKRLIDVSEWLHAHGLYSMVYIGMGRVRCLGHKNFKEEYLVHADVEVTNADGTVTLMENTVNIPWILGTGKNPDVGRSSDGKLRTDVYLDITNEEAVKWFFDEIWGQMIDFGIDGVKIDFCEELPDDGKSYGTSVTHYRWKDPSKMVAGTEHHAYPTCFISAFYKRMVELKAEKGKPNGFMVFSRGGGIGSQRSPYMWAGDQGRQYEKLDDQVMAVVNSGLSGIPFMSYDMGGYQYWDKSYHVIGKENESALFARATEFTAFMTQMQTHGDVRHAYEMTEEVQKIYRNFTGLHKELIPYMQKYSKIACETGMPPVRHLVLKYLKDENVRDLIDEFMLGDAILVAPILAENTYQRDVYLPEGSWTNMLTGEIVEGGKTVHVAANLGQIPVFLDNNSPDVAELLPIFNGIYWKQIKNFK